MQGQTPDESKMTLTFPLAEAPRGGGEKKRDRDPRPTQFVIRSTADIRSSLQHPVSDTMASLLALSTVRKDYQFALLQMECVTC
jgi:hypothetical protein